MPFPNWQTYVATVITIAFVGCAAPSSTQESTDGSRALPKVAHASDQRCTLPIVVPKTYYLRTAYFRVLSGPYHVSVPAEMYIRFPTSDPNEFEVGVASPNLGTTARTITVEDLGTGVSMHFSLGFSTLGHQTAKSSTETVACPAEPVAVPLEVVSRVSRFTLEGGPYHVSSTTPGTVTVDGQELRIRCTHFTKAGCNMTITITNSETNATLTFGDRLL